MKLKITIFDQSLSKPRAEIVEVECCPQITQHHTMTLAGYGPIVKIEMLMDASESDTFDTTEQGSVKV